MIHAVVTEPMKKKAKSRVKKIKRPTGFWKEFNDWWRSFRDGPADRRPYINELRGWYDANALSVWSNEERPDFSEVQTIAKGLRSKSDVRAYFKEYRRKKKIAKRAGGAKQSEQSEQSSGESSDDDTQAGIPPPTPRHGQVPAQRPMAPPLQLGPVPYSPPSSNNNNNNNGTSSSAAGSALSPMPLGRVSSTGCNATPAEANAQQQGSNALDVWVLNSKAIQALAAAMPMPNPMPAPSAATTDTQQQQYGAGGMLDGVDCSALPHQGQAGEDKVGAWCGGSAHADHHGHFAAQHHQQQQQHDGVMAGECEPHHHDHMLVPGMPMPMPEVSHMSDEDMEGDVGHYPHHMHSHGSIPGSGMCPPAGPGSDHMPPPSYAPGMGWGHYGPHHGWDYPHPYPPSHYPYFPPYAGAPPPPMPCPSHAPLAATGDASAAAHASMPPPAAGAAAACAPEPGLSSAVSSDVSDRQEAGADGSKQPKSSLPAASQQQQQHGPSMHGSYMQPPPYMPPPMGHYYGPGPGPSYHHHHHVPYHGGYPQRMYSGGAGWHGMPARSASTGVIPDHPPHHHHHGYGYGLPHPGAYGGPAPGAHYAYPPPYGYPGYGPSSYHAPYPHHPHTAMHQQHEHDMEGHDTEAAEAGMGGEDHSLMMHHQQQQYNHGSHACVQQHQQHQEQSSRPGYAQQQQPLGSGQQASQQAQARAASSTPRSRGSVSVHDSMTFGDGECYVTLGVAGQGVGGAVTRARAPDSPTVTAPGARQGGASKGQQQALVGTPCSPLNSECHPTAEAVVTLKPLGASGVAIKGEQQPAVTADTAVHPHLPSPLPKGNEPLGLSTPVSEAWHGHGELDLGLGLGLNDPLSLFHSPNFPTDACMH